MALAVRSILQEMSSTPPLSSRTWDAQRNVDLNLIPESFVTPSPEEQIIRQRSRIALFETEGNENETPSKGLFACQQGRKRLLMSPPHASPIKCNKRSRLENSRKLPPLKTELNAYTTEQLVGIIDKLINNYPHLESEIRDTLPLPDMKPLEERLNTLQRRIYKAFPNTRWGSSRDAFCYKRVKVHLEEFKKTSIEQGRLLLTAQCWEAVVGYVIIAWKYNAKLPNWDDISHNKSKEIVFRTLASQCLQAIKNGHFEREVYAEIKRKLQTLSLHNSELEHCIKECDKILDKLV